MTSPHAISTVLVPGGREENKYVQVCIQLVSPNFANFIIAFFCPTSWVIQKQLDPSSSRATGQ